MNFNSSEEDPVLVHLQKWRPLQMDLAQFREAFISPTRELLLLLSYHHEGLLFPLIKGVAVSNSDQGYGDLGKPELSASSPPLAAPRESGLRVDNQYASDPVNVVSNNIFQLETEFVTSNSYPMLSDINSLAWGICEDFYNLHEEVSFREVLFVSGNYGLTVHAFRQPTESIDLSQHAVDGKSGEGIWVEWGPSTAVPHTMDVSESSSLNHSSSQDKLDVDKQNNDGATGDDEPSKSYNQRRWLQTFLMKVKTVKSKGKICSRFPDKSKFPSSAAVISFNIFEDDPTLMRFLLYGSTNLSQKESPTSSSHVVGEKNILYESCRVFVKSSHDLIGFALTLVDPFLVDTTDASERKQINNILAVARMVSWGIQWIFSVKLEENAYSGPMNEWTDFKFSDTYLICLNDAGLMFFYGHTTGEYVGCVNLLEIYGVHPRSKSMGVEKLFVKGDLPPKVANLGGDDQSFTLSHQTGDLVGKSRFKTLLVASCTSLLAVIDDYGIIYVVCSRDHIPEVFNSDENSLPLFQQLGQNTLVGWEVGGADISHQKPYSNISPNMTFVRGRSYSKDKMESSELPAFHDRTGMMGHESVITGFSSASQRVQHKIRSSAPSPCALRSIILPTDKCKNDDTICLSPFGITRLIRNQHTAKRRSSHIVYFNLSVDSATNDDKGLSSVGQELFFEEAVGCTFHGCLYLVTEDALSVVLPSISVSSGCIPIEAIGYRQTSKSSMDQAGNLIETKGLKQPWPTWKIEVLDRVLLYEGREEADHLCSENGWDMKVSRIRSLQLALEYLDFEEIEISLEMLTGVGLAEEGILRLIFAAVYLMLNKGGNDNDVSAASRLLALGTHFSTKMIRRYGSLQHMKSGIMSRSITGMKDSSLPLLLSDNEYSETENSGRLEEMAHLLEIIRKMQSRLITKFKKTVSRLVDGLRPVEFVDSGLSQDDSKLSKPSTNVSLLQTDELKSITAEDRALISVDSLDSRSYSHLENVGGVVIPAIETSFPGRSALSFENPKDMIARWQTDNLDQKNIVRDALLSGRLPLAVLRLHLHHQENMIPDKEPHDTFEKVRDIGRAIAYDLFLKDETELGVATLLKLGEDMQSCLQQLVFGTVRRSLRMQIAEVMNTHGYLGPFEWKILEGISLIERVYPCSSFWGTFNARQKELVMIKVVNSPEEIKLPLLHSPSNNLTIQCGEIDGVVLGIWTDVSKYSEIPVVDADSTHSCYWAAAAVWSDAWDQRTIDRIVLDRSLLVDVDISWESQLEYHICYNNLVEASRLVDCIPSYSYSHGNLRISLDSLQGALPGNNSEFSDYGNYIYSIDDLDAVVMDIPDIRILRFSAINTCSLWLKSLMELQLAKKFIFLKEYWEGTKDIVCLLARSGFVTNTSDISLVEQSIEDPTDPDFTNINKDISPAALRGSHKLFVRHCALHNLPDLLDLYLDHHKLVLDYESLSALQEAAGDCQWAKWLLLSRVKGNEYEASFSNARSIAARNLVPGNSLGASELDDIIHTVDDIAEGAGEMAAIATLMYAPVPIQDCLSTGSVNRNRSSSAQCTLENLRPAMQRFPTLWRTLVAACFGQDPTCSFYSSRSKVFGNSNISDYLNWRDNIFYSTGHDTSLLQMLPGWFSKAVRRLVQLFVQGPLGWQSVSGLPAAESVLFRDVDYGGNSNEEAKISTLSWEAAIQRHVEEELYGSSVEGSGLGLEHNLHRGRALAAFIHILSLRVKKLKFETGTHRVQSDTSVNGQSNVQSDVHTLLSPITENEESLLSSVMPLAITHFEDPVLVASCAFLLELCGLSPNMLQVDIAAMRRISSFFKSVDHTDNLSLKGPAFMPTPIEGDITGSLAQALAEYYLKTCNTGIAKKKDNLNTSNTKQTTRALMLVLQNLEKASLPSLAGGTTCGYWLMSGNGDGADLRSQQKAASQHWNLVTTFCRMHEMPMSTKYLAALAKDNDWVGFLSEAQVGGHPFDTVVQVASKEFSDPRLKVHISTVLKGMLSRKKVSSSSNFDSTNRRNESSSFTEDNTYIPIELFGIIADCEKQKNPGEALLLKAKDLCWSVLAMVASCFPDVSPLCCLTVWLEITAARETSSIKVNDIASQISNNVRAAVEANNLLRATARAQTLHYNHRNPKRRRLMEFAPADTLTSKGSDVSTNSSGTSIFADQGITPEGGKQETDDEKKVLTDSDKVFVSLSKMVAVLCEQRLFLPLLRAFEMFLPSSSILPFIRALQAFSQMRLSEASVHLGSFAARIKEEPLNIQTTVGRDGSIGTSWISSIAVKASNAMLATCPSPYEKRCLLQLLSATDFGDGGSAMTHYRRLYWKINLAEPLLRKDDDLQLGNESLDDASLLTALETNGHWEQARNWAKQLEASGEPWKSAAHHVTETQAESMVAEWKEFLWDVPEERVALWGHCQMLFLRYSFPPLQAGLFFLKHAEAVDKDLPPKELHELLLLSLQWLSGMITQSTPVYPLHLLRELETRVWLLAVESEAQIKSEGELTLTSSNREAGNGKGSSIIDHTASIIAKMDNHINAMKSKSERSDARDYHPTHHKNPQGTDATISTTSGASTKLKRRAKGVVHSRRPLIDTVEKTSDSEDGFSSNNTKSDSNLAEENSRMDLSLSKWEESIGPMELERAVLSLLEFGQITAARQLQHKLSPSHLPSEFVLVDAALKLAAMSTPSNKVAISMLDDEVHSVIQSYDLPTDHQWVDPIQVLESLTTFFVDGRGLGLCKRLVSVVKAANVLGLSFVEAFNILPIELLQLLSLKAQDSFEEAYLLIQTHSMAPASIAQILAESFLKGLLAAHRGGYIDSQKDEGPAPLLWRFSDFLKWAELCPSEPEIGHALMRLVITGQEIPHACEVELLILSHHFYKSSACLDGVDVLVALAATRVDAYVSEGDFPCLARLITGVGNFHALNFILGILIENGQLELLLQKYSAAADAHSSTAQAVRGFRMAVLTSLKQFNPSDFDAFAMVYNHFDMKHETAALLESRAVQSFHMWFLRHNKDHTEDLLESMRYYIEAAEVHSSIDAGNKTRAACARASLVSLQIRMPDFQWLNLSATNARRALVEQSRFQEALIVAEAYDLNQPGEWALVLWNQMLKPDLTEQFVAEFVAVLPLHPTMLGEIARFYRAEVAARGDQSQFSVWLTGGGLPAEWAKYLGISFRCLLRRTRDLRLRLQLATIATGFGDVVKACSKALDRVPENGGPLVLRKGHGGAYLPLM